MNDIQSEINDRVEHFVNEISELARRAAYEALSSALEHEIAPAVANATRPTPSTPAPRTRQRSGGGKRPPEELARMADEFLDYVTNNPGERMEHIAKALGYVTKDLNLPVKKLTTAGKLRLEGQKRATTYYPAGKGSGSGGGVKVRRQRKRRKSS
ncbi:MAG: hypothetical protein Tsb0020_18480 [Haliangiales bacterium]